MPDSLLIRQSYYLVPTRWARYGEQPCLCPTTKGGKVNDWEAYIEESVSHVAVYSSSSKRDSKMNHITA